MGQSCTSRHRRRRRSRRRYQSSRCPGKLLTHCNDCFTGRRRICLICLLLRDALDWFLFPLAPASNQKTWQNQQDAHRRQLTHCHFADDLLAFYKHVEFLLCSFAQVCVVVGSKKNRPMVLLFSLIPAFVDESATANSMQKISKDHGSGGSRGHDCLKFLLLYISGHPFSA